LEDKIAKTSGHLRRILGYFGEFFGFWDNFNILYFFIFFKFKKIKGVIIELGM
jgi:hypothetical protein